MPITGLTTTKETEGRRRPERERSADVLTTAELAECTCPEPCERDHDRD